METIKINEKQFNALSATDEVMVDGAYTTGMLYLLEHGNNTIVSCCVMSWDIKSEKRNCRSKLVPVQQIIEKYDKKDIVCVKCGGTNVQCEAWVKANTKEFIACSDEKFSSGYCADCDAFVLITDVTKNKTAIENAYEKHLEERGKEPLEADCIIVFKDKPKEEHEVTIKLSMDVDEDNDDEIFFYCNGVIDLKSLCEYGSQDFIITWFYQF